MTFYRVLNKKGEVVISNIKNGDACFYQYNYELKKLENRRIEVKVYKKIQEKYGHYFAFTKKQVEFYLCMLNENYFKCSLKEFKSYFIIIAYEKDYICHSHIVTFLDFLRVLWENDQNKALRVYFNLSKIRIVVLFLVVYYRHNLLLFHFHQ